MKLGKELGEVDGVGLPIRNHVNFAFYCEAVRFGSLLAPLDSMGSWCFK